MYVLVSIASTLGCIFVPKFVMIWEFGADGDTTNSMIGSSGKPQRNKRSRTQSGNSSEHESSVKSSTSYHFSSGNSHRAMPRRSQGGSTSGSSVVVPSNEVDISALQNEIAELKAALASTDTHNTRFGSGQNVTVS